MGLWRGLFKLAKGELIYSLPEEKNASAKGTSEEKQKSTVLDEQGKKIIPTVEIKNCKSRLIEDSMEVTAWVTNISDVIIELDKITLVGETAELDRILSPNEGREIKLYRGKPPTDDSLHTAQLQYKRRDNGDYFRADFEVEYNRDSRGFYEVEELHPIHPLRDV